VSTNSSDAFQALADPSRRAVLERLLEGPRSVNDIAAGLPVSRPAVSQHLRVLREADLVSEQRLGTRRIYRLEPGGLTALRTYLDGFWTAALAQFADAAERNERRKA
jgi:DNA-binding transcriptional ArsR family regulator